MLTHTLAFSEEIQEARYQQDFARLVVLMIACDVL